MLLHPGKSAPHIEDDPATAPSMGRRSHRMLIGPSVHVEYADAKKYGLVSAALFREFDTLALSGDSEDGEAYADAAYLYKMLPEFTPEAVADAAEQWAESRNWDIGWNGLIPLIRVSARAPSPKSIKSRRPAICGYVYVLTNPAIGGMVKIGVTSNSPEIRAKLLSAATGVPAPFQVAYSIRVPDSYHVEKSVHRILGEYRVPGREFFTVSVADAIETIEYAAIQSERE